MRGVERLEELIVLFARPCLDIDGFHLCPPVFSFTVPKGTGRSKFLLQLGVMLVRQFEIDEVVPFNPVERRMEVTPALLDELWR